MRLPPKEAIATAIPTLISSHSFWNCQLCSQQLRNIVAASIRIQRTIVFMSWEELREDALEWCQGKRWEWRVPLLAYLAYIAFRTLTNAEYGSLFSGITFGIHELGHICMSFAGEFLMIAGGSIFQILAPLIVALLFFRQREYFGITVAGSWLSLSLIELARYIGDARSQQLPLLGLTSDPQHDWNYLLSKLGMLESDLLLAGLTRIFAVAIFVSSLVAGGWLCFQMAQLSRARKKA